VTVAGQIAHRLRRTIKVVRNAAGLHICPVCRHTVKAFEPLDPRFLSNWRTHGFDLDPKRFETLNVEAYQCPHCGASDRDRLLALYLERGKPYARSGVCIEFAPSGPLTRAIRAHFPGWTCRTADLNMRGVDDRVDICDMSAVYPEASADIVLCSHVLEHVADDRQALREIWRILKPGGRAILLVPLSLQLDTTREVDRDATPAERWRRVAQDDHVRLHSVADFKQRIIEARFDLEILGRGEFGAEVMDRAGITPTSRLYIGHKP
jgi:SAM-dependent methyltransferase